MSNKRDKTQKLERQARAEAEYKLFTKALLSVERGEDQKRIQEIITEHISKSDDLYPLIKKRLAGSAADAKHLKYLLNLCQESAQNIDIPLKPFDTVQLAKKWLREHKRSVFDFIDEEVKCSCYEPHPTFEFFYGSAFSAIRNESPERKERKKRVKIQAEEAETVSATEKNITTDCEQDSTPKEVDAIHQRIKRVYECRKKSVEFLTVVVQPESFTQTVENIFHASFLVKENRVIIKGDKNNRPVICPLESSEATQERNKPKKQSILSFSVADFNKWREQSR